MANTSQEYVSGLVKLMGEKSPIAYQFLNKHGKAMGLKKTSISGTMPMGECFRNSYLCLQPGQTYCEGYAAPKGTGFPLEHAWILDVDGRVIDPTWETGTDYFGVPFNEMFLTTVMLKTGYHSVLGNLFRLRMTPAEVLSYLENGVSE